MLGRYIQTGALLSYEYARHSHLEPSHLTSTHNCYAHASLPEHPQRNLRTVYMREFADATGVAKYCFRGFDGRWWLGSAFNLRDLLSYEVSHCPLPPSHPPHTYTRCPARLIDLDG